MSKNIDNVLNAWKLVEMLQFKDLPSDDGKRHEQRIERLVDISEWFKYDYKNLKMDFDENIEKYKKDNPKENIKESSYDCTLYLGCYIKENYLEYFRKIKNIEEEVFNKNTEKSFVVCIKIDEDKKIRMDTLFIPDTSIILMNPNIKIGENFKTYKDEIEEKIISALKLYENKSLNQHVFDDLRVDIIKIFENKTIEGLKNNFFKKDYAFEKIIFEGEEIQEFNLSSFYIPDIEKVIKKGKDDLVVSTYIDGYKGKSIDINENREDIEKVLEPKNIPLAKWPSPVAYKLSLMQAVAVNVVVNEMLKSNDLVISSVNGPPGTGKTTLLKDIFANIVVERTKELVKIDPKDLFEGKQEKICIPNDNFTLYSNKLNEKVARFGMVVASSNNGAVENISKELPELKQLSRPESKDFNKFQNGVEENYRNLVTDLNLFPKVSKKILDVDSWGIFSAPFGKSKNISDVLGILIPSKNNEHNKENTSKILFDELKEFEVEAKSGYKEVVKRFNELVSLIEKKKLELQQMSKVFKEQDRGLSVEEDEYEINKNIGILNEIKIREGNISEIIDHLPKPGLFKRMLGSVSEDEVNYKKEQVEIIKERQKVENEIRNLEDKLKLRKEYIIKTTNKLNDIKTLLEDENKKFVVSDNTFWEGTNDITSKSYDIRQQKTPWLSDELEALRGELFIVALKVHKYYNAINFQKLKNNFTLLKNRKNLDMNIADHRKYLKEAWKSVHLIFPVISTTFASLASMYAGVDDKIIDYLFIDEAGQASPQQAIGGVWRSKNVICVGDPIQIEPVVSISEAFLSDIKSIYNLRDGNPYIGETASVQVLSDLASKYGSMKSENERIGIPLWVHRRCLNPMFDVANNIAYDGKMVLAIKKSGKGEWINSIGTSDDKFVKENAKILLERLEQNWKDAKNAKNHEGLPSVYVITPFTNIKDKLIEFLKKELVEKGYDEEIVKKWVKKSIGTVHTFQGKEADIVYFVCGTDEKSDGAANWSCTKPNILNVAVTRAKKEFYIIADEKRFKEKQYYDEIFRVLEKFNKK